MTLFTPLPMPGLPPNFPADLAANLATDVPMTVSANGLTGSDVPAVPAPLRVPALPERPERLERYAECSLPTHAGHFRLLVYRARDGLEAMAVVAGEPAGEATLVRVHSECWTGETLGSLRCDCRDQLDGALAAIGERTRGVLVYLRQEGRGIGLANKVRAYALQQCGADTVEANRLLGFADDLRTYDVAAAILHDLQVRSVELMTNNPLKLDALEAHGIRVERRLPHWRAEQEFNRDYLETKRRRQGHLV